MSHAGRYGDMQYDLIQGQDHEPLKVGNSVIIKGYLLPLQWGLAKTPILKLQGKT